MGLARLLQIPVFGLLSGRSTERKRNKNGRYFFLAASPTLSAAGLLLLPGLIAHGATNRWNALTVGSNNWSNPSNWSAGVTPSSSDYVSFGDAGTSGTASNINNVVDALFTSPIGPLHYENTTGFHSTLIAPGGVLRLADELRCGVDTSFEGVSRTNVITGESGTLSMTNSSRDLIVQDVFVSYFSPAPVGSGLDLSGLGTFSAALSRIAVGDGSGTNSAAGVLFLARTNVIVANGAAPAIVICGGGTNVQAARATAGSLVLGQTNGIFSDTISVGSGYLRPDNSCFFGFGAGFSNPRLVLRGQDITNRVESLNIADGPTQGATPQQPLVNVDFSGGLIDLQVDKLLVARVGTNTIALSGMASKGTLSLGAGSTDVNLLQVGVNLWTNPSYAVGLVNVLNGGVLTVNQSLELGNCISNTAFSRQTCGTLNIKDGTVMANQISAKYASTNNTITLTNGFLIITNGPVSGICNFSMTNSRLMLPLLETPGLIVTNFVTGGSSNTVDVSVKASITTSPTQLVLIKYSGSIGGAGYNLQLGTVSPPAYSGTLVNNTNNGSVDVSLTAFRLGAIKTNGAFEVLITSVPGSSVGILRSSNFVDWASLGVITNSTGNYTFLDYSVTNNSVRFYKAQLLQ